MHAGDVPSIQPMERWISDKILCLNLLPFKKVYANSDLSVEKLSKELNISRVHLYRKLKIYRAYPIDLLRNFRMSKAVELLDKQLYSVSEIAYRTGFLHPHIFKVF